MNRVTVHWLGNSSHCLTKPVFKPGLRSTLWCKAWYGSHTYIHLCVCVENSCHEGCRRLSILTDASIHNARTSAKQMFDTLFWEPYFFIGDPNQRSYYTQVSEIQVLLTYMFPLHISNGRYMHIDLKNPIRCSKKTFISLPPSYHRFILWYYPLRNLQFFFLCPLFASHAPELLHLKCDCVTIKIQVANSFNSQLSLGKNIKLEAIRTTDCERQIDN